MIETVGAERRSVRRWVVLAVVVVLLAAGGVTALSLPLRYLHAAPLSTNGGGWIGADAAQACSVTAGVHSASVVGPRPGYRQTFELSLGNPSGVSQTVLGLVDGETLADPQLTGEPQTLQVSTTPTFPGSDEPVRFTSRPVTIAPHRQYSLRFTEVTSADLWAGGRSESIEQLRLRVRVGMFTRTETVDLGPLIMEIRSPKPSC